MIKTISQRGSRKEFDVIIIGSGIAIAAQTAIPWLTAKVMTSPTIRRAVAKMPTALIGGDVTPGTIARSLIAAGASQADVQELIDMEGQ